MRVGSGGRKENTSVLQESLSPWDFLGPEGNGKRLGGGVRTNPNAMKRGHPFFFQFPSFNETAVERGK